MVSGFPLVKNAAQRIIFPILDADGDPTGGCAALDSEYSIDGGVFTDCTNEATNMTSGGANTGVYYLDLVAAETNGDVICIQVKTSTAGAKTTVLVFYTSAQSLDTVDTNVDSILADTNELQTDWTNGGRLDLLLDEAITDIVAVDGKVDVIDNYIDTEVAAIKAVTDTLSLAAIADAVHDEAVEGAITSREAVRLILAALAGKTSEVVAGTLVIRDANDTADRITATMDANRYRTGVVLNP